MSEETKKALSKKSRQRCEVYSRVVGYIRPVSQWNKGKKSEFEERQTFNVCKN